MDTQPRLYNLDVMFHRLSLSRALSISTVSLDPETGVFRFVFDAGDVEVSADLTVAWIEDKGAAFLQWCEVDRVRTRNQDLARAVVVWVWEHQREVFEAALNAEAA